MSARHPYEMVSEAFRKYAQERSTPGSNMPSSYVQSIHKLNSILKEHTTLLHADEDLWQMTDVERLAGIYQAILAAQKMSGGGFFAGTPTPSYWKQYFYSSAVKMLSSFQALYQREEKMLALADKARDAAQLADELDAFDIPRNPLYWDDDVPITSAVGKERLAQIKVRENQHVFRKMVLRNYRCQCCLCGLPVVETLRASHISEWAKDAKNRMNPENGLCLSATYDAAFDRHLISFDEDYRLVISPSLRDYFTNAAFNDQFKKLEGTPIQMPTKFLPSKELMRRHMAQLA